MDLKRKLSLLAAPLTARSSEENQTRARSIEDLRAKMEALLGPAPTAPAAPAAPAAPRADPAQTSLPFGVESTPWGPVCRRCETRAASAHVGRMPVDSAGAASAQMLALLALDPSLARVEVHRALYVDTETTGLGGGAGVLPFLVGVAWLECREGPVVLEQFLVREPGEEVAMLELLRQRVEAASCLVSFNGKSFDLPLLRNRYIMNRLEPLPELPHLDLLHIGRRLHRKRLGGSSLKLLESEVLGFQRGPDIEGAEVAPRYAHFLRTGDEAPLRAVVEHNVLDVLSMAALVGLYGEPLEVLHQDDLVGLAHTLRRAKALSAAEEAADTAIRKGAGPDAHWVRGSIAKARGDRDAALSDFEALNELVDDPKVRLELAKLYEHHVKEPLTALRFTEAGTGEAPEALIRRRKRLQRKAAKKR